MKRLAPCPSCGLNVIRGTGRHPCAWCGSPLNTDYAEQDEDGQLSIGVTGEQRAIPGLAQRREHPTFDMGA